MVESELFPALRYFGLRFYAYNPVSDWNVCIVYCVLFCVCLFRSDSTTPPSWLVASYQEGIGCLICTNSLRGDSGLWEVPGQKREGEEGLRSCQIKHFIS